MSKSMRKIIYYENILEFKKNTKDHLNLNELNNWQLCRTCLEDTREDDVNMETMSVMDLMQETFLSIKEMLAQTTNIEVSTTENFPLQLCKECVSKITALYYFSIQVRKADKILKQLKNKLKQHQNIAEVSIDTEDNCTDNGIPPDNVIYELEVYDYTEMKDLEDTENSLPKENNAFNEFKNSAEVEEKISDIEELLTNDEVSSLKYVIAEDVKVLRDKEMDADLQGNSIEYEGHFINDLIEVSENTDSDNEETRIISATITTDDAQNEVKKIKRASNIVPGYRHKQPRVTSPLLNNFDCAICQDSFGRQQDLVHHVRESHPNTKAYKCRVCGNLFSHIQSLSRHMNSHKEAVILNECDFCSKTFVRADDLKRHLRVHTGERPYVCSLCEKSFQQQSDLKFHEEKHLYGDKKLKKYECTHCKQTYASRTGLYLHKKKHHRLDDSELPYDCSLCEKSFYLQSELKRHARHHFKPELIKCSECIAYLSPHSPLCKNTEQHNSKNEAERENEDITTIENDDQH